MAIFILRSVKGGEFNFPCEVNVKLKKKTFLYTYESALNMAQFCVFFIQGKKECFKINVLSVVVIIVYLVLMKREVR
jgi:hypothetical protein